MFSYLPTMTMLIPPPNAARFSTNSVLYANSELTNPTVDPLKKETSNPPAVSGQKFLTSLTRFTTTIWSSNPSNIMYNPPPRVRAKFSSNEQSSTVAFKGKNGFIAMEHPPPLPGKASRCSIWVGLRWTLAGGSEVLLRKVHFSTLSCGLVASILSRWYPTERPPAWPLYCSNLIMDTGPLFSKVQLATRAVWQL